MGDFVVPAVVEGPWVQSQQQCLDLLVAQHQARHAAAHGIITQAVYDGLNGAMQAELKEHTQICHVAMVEKDLDPTKRNLVG